jgi:nitrogen fixation NifU-like protein
MSDDLRELYQETILDHGKHPRNFRRIEPCACEAVGHNPLCGDKLVLYVSLDDNKRIDDLSFQGSGCAISTASASMMTEIAKGKTIEEAEKLFDFFHKLCTGEEPDAQGLDEDDVDRLRALSGVRNFPVRVKCATLAWHTLDAALKNEKKVTTE